MTKSPRIPYTKPSITELEIAYARDAAEYGWGDACYEYIRKFEDAFSRHLGVKHSIATSSCTGSLHMGLHALGIGRGDEVILANTNWIASVAPIVHCGAKPVFVDIKADTWCIDPERVANAITPQTKAILAVHLYGNLCELEALRQIADLQSIHLIEDAAEAIGSVYQGKKAGSLGKFGTFSFHGTKTVTTGEGGMFVTNDTELYERVLTLSNHGRDRNETRQFWPSVVGFKYKMSNIQAAIGLAQTERIESLIARRQDVLEMYRDQLAPLSGLQLNRQQSNCVLGAWMPTIVFDRELNVHKDTLIEAFQSDNIDARTFFPALSSLAPFLTFTNADACPVSYDLPERAINLPSFHDITGDEIQRVVSVIKKVYGQAQ